jgi:hypothetical protein
VEAETSSSSSESPKLGSVPWVIAGRAIVADGDVGATIQARCGIFVGGALEEGEGRGVANIVG